MVREAVVAEGQELIPPRVRARLVASEPLESLLLMEQVETVEVAEVQVHHQTSAHRPLLETAVQEVREQRRALALLESDRLVAPEHPGR